MDMRTLLTLVAGLLLPAGVFANSLTLRNECRSSLVVQTSTLVRGAMQRDQPNLVRPGETTPKLPLERDRIITVYDGRSSRVLYQGIQRYSPVPVRYSIQPDPRTPGKVRLVPATIRPGG